MSAAARRAAYEWVRDAINLRAREVEVPRHMDEDVAVEVWRIRDAMHAASQLVDEPGVEGHVSGDGKPKAEKGAPFDETLPPGAPYTGGGGSLL